jgi:hypothetical protein
MNHYPAMRRLTRLYGRYRILGLAECLIMAPLGLLLFRNKPVPESATACCWS